MSQGACIEQIGNRLAAVGKCFPGAEVDIFIYFFAVNEQRDILAGVVGMEFMGWVAPMISRNDEDVVTCHGIAQPRQAPIKCLQGDRIALGIAPMPVNHIEINQICEYQSALMMIFVHGCDGFVNSIRIVAGVNFFGQSLVVEYVTDFSDAGDKAAPVLEVIQSGQFGRGD